MGLIDTCFQKVEGCLASFSIKTFASILQPRWIDEVLQATGRQTMRERKLTAPFVVWLTIAMGLFRNLSIQNVVKRMGNVLGAGSLWEGGKPPAGSSLAQARDRIGYGPLRLLQERIRDWALKTYRGEMSWRGLGVLALDGTTMKVPDSEENRRRFGLPKASRGRSAFPQMRAVFLVAAKLHLILQAEFAPYRRGEFKLAMRLLPTIPRESLVIMDRYYNGWELLLGLRDRASHFLVRMRKNMRGRTIGIFGPGDRLLEAVIPRHLHSRCPNFPKRIVVRELTARIGRRWFRYWTSLVDPAAYPAEELVGLYAQRWEEELVLDEIKTHQGGATTVNRPLILRCTTSRRVLQEAYGIVLAYTLVRILMAQGAQSTGVPPLRISFVGSLELIRQATLLMARAPTEALPQIFRDLLHSIGECILEARRKRKNRREVCIKMSAYKLKEKTA